MQVSPEVITGVIAGIVVLWMVVAFNSLVALRAKVQNAWAEIDVQLKRRHDLVPNLVETVRGYMQHETSTLEAVTQARTQAVATANGTIAQRSAAESLLGGALGNLLAVAENYPQLRAVESVQILQEQLTSTENRIAAARQFYNDEVMRYNTTQSTFPRNLFAGWLGFSLATMFASEDADRANIQVRI